MKRTHYYSIGSMLTDEEVHQVWEIVGNALDRNGFVDADGELSIRVYDETLKRNVKVLDKSLYEVFSTECEFDLNDDYDMSKDDRLKS